MTRNWQHPDRAPTPAELSAWADGELDPDDAARVESWLITHPEAESEVESSSRLLSLFRDHPPADPSPAAWNDALHQIAARAERHRPRWQAWLLLTLATAAVVAAVTTAMFLPRPVAPIEMVGVTLPPEDDNDEPFPVAVAGEVNIVHMDARDADRVLIGQPLLDSFDVVASEDIELVSVEANWEEGNMPHLKRGPQFPMVIVARPVEEP
jgi:hypothetical protein